MLGSKKWIEEARLRLVEDQIPTEVLVDMAAVLEMQGNEWNMKKKTDSNGALVSFARLSVPCMVQNLYVAAFRDSPTKVHVRIHQCQ